MLGTWERGWARGMGMEVGCNAARDKMALGNQPTLPKQTDSDYAFHAVRAPMHFQGACSSQLPLSNLAAYLGEGLGDGLQRAAVQQVHCAATLACAKAAKMESQAQSIDQEPDGRGGE